MDLFTFVDSILWSQSTKTHRSSTANRSTNNLIRQLGVLMSVNDRRLTHATSGIRANIMTARPNIISGINRIRLQRCGRWASRVFAALRRYIVARRPWRLSDPQPRPLPVASSSLVLLVRADYRADVGLRWMTDGSRLASTTKK